MAAEGSTKPHERTHGLTVRVLAILAMVATVACSGPLQLANIQIGRSLNQDRSIASITTLFKPSETVYVAVQTGAGKGDDLGEVEIRHAGDRRADQAGRLQRPGIHRVPPAELRWISAGRLQRRRVHRRRAGRHAQPSRSVTRVVRLKADTTGNPCGVRL